MAKLQNLFDKKGRKPLKKLKLGVLFGGTSTEHEISVISGTSVIYYLDKEKYDIFPIYISKKGEWYRYQKDVKDIEIAKLGEEIKPLERIENELEYLRKLDVVFPVLHGKQGEDGTMQGLLEIAHIPYVGCRILASSVGMDKVYTKLIFDQIGLRQAPYLYIRKMQKGYYFIEKDFTKQLVSLQEISQKVEQTLHYPVFIKPSNSRI